MHPQEKTRLILSAAALVATAAVLSLVIVFTGVSLETVGSFAALVVLGWLVSAAATRFVERRQRNSQVAPQPSVDSHPVAEPPEPPPAEPFRIPDSIDPPRVVGALATAGSALGDVTAAGLWLEDSATATLRLVASAGRIPHGDAPLVLDEDPAGDALLRHVPVWSPLADMTDPSGRHRIWRFIQPIVAGDARGAAILDLACGQSVPLASVVDATRHLRGILAGALALHVARLETLAARELVEAARALSRCLDAQDVLECALSRAMVLAAGESGSVLLLGDDGMLRIAESRGLAPDVIASTVIAPGEGIAGWVLSTNKPLLVEDLPSQGRRTSHRSVRSAVCVPLGDEDGVVGVLSVGSHAFPARFTRNHMDALEILARQACVAYRNSKALDATRDLYFSTLRTLAIAMETKDPYARGSTDRVLDLTSALGRAMELSEADLASLEIAALFHDLGMSATGTTAILDDRPLTTIERGLVAMHPVIAADVLRAAPALRDVAPIVYHHHERYDGRGYVGGILGDAIPVGARILAVVDAYVAMTSPRPYRDALTHESAVRELANNAGTQFDPVAVERFVAILEGRGTVRDSEGTKR